MNWIFLGIFEDLQSFFQENILSKFNTDEVTGSNAKEIVSSFFEHNPIDLLTFDHLTRFTPNTIQTIFRDAHLVPIRRFSNSDQVPMGWTLTVKDNVASETMSLQWSLEKELNNTYLKQDWLK